MTTNDAIRTADHGPTSGREGVFHMTKFKIALESLATLTIADLVMFIVVSAVARVFHSPPVDSTWSPPQ